MVQGCVRRPGSTPSFVPLLIREVDVIMPVKEQKRNRIGLDVSQLDEQGLSDVVSAILQSAPSSALFKANPTLQSSVAALGVLASSYQTATDTVIADRAK